MGDDDDNDVIIEIMKYTPTPHSQPSPVLPSSVTPSRRQMILLSRIPQTWSPGPTEMSFKVPFTDFQLVPSGYTGTISCRIQGWPLASSAHTAVGPAEIRRIGTACSGGVTLNHTRPVICWSVIPCLKNTLPCLVTTQAVPVPPPRVTDCAGCSRGTCSQQIP